MVSGTAGLLIAAAAGYWVFERASTRKRSVMRIGQWVGGAIMVVSLLGVACRVWYRVCGATGWDPAHKMMYCPFMPGSPNSSGTTSPVSSERGKSKP